MFLESSHAPGAPVWMKRAYRWIPASPREPGARELPVAAEVEA
jgi:hypothetical protein